MAPALMTLRRLALLPALAAVLLGALALPAPAAAQGAAGARTCPDPSRIRGLCVYVSNKTHRDAHTFMYQIRLQEAACIEEGDDLPERRRKVQALWDASETQLVCTSRGVNVLKIAVENDFSEFIDEMVKDYEVNLNIIDTRDGKTVLDFIRDQIERTLDDNYRSKLTNYYSAFRARGARHRADLPRDSPEVQDYCRRAPGGAGC